ncbi:APC family permease [Clostridium algoriphilum]|uniref:APC family permease n=1 Tax=Clostridium algoriphilum TaxID=198347 RepID=UPI001CF4AA16|nr:APC family permease [Clostridium algoriphilum]MCB2294804.1 APC family permease [Clostridium algoriphilum]
MSKSGVNYSKQNETKLKSEYLSFFEVLAQSIGSIAPTASLAFVIPLVYGTAGNGTWLAYTFAFVAVALVAVNLNHFASRSASPGSLFTYIVNGLGPTAGFISGWALLLAYLITTSAVICGFINYANVLLMSIGISIPLVVLGLIGAISAWYVAYKDIKLSANLTLVLEGISLISISMLGIIVLIHNGFKIDLAQLTLKGVSPTSIRIGLVIAFFSFAGFESAASLGGEAKKPLLTIPKAVLSSVIIVGIFFVIFSYIEVLGFIGSSVKLNAATAPLDTLAKLNSVGFLGPIISLGTMLSFWASFLACANAGARLLFSIGRHGIVNSYMGNVHDDNNTPYIAISVISLIATLVPIILICLNNKIFDIYGWLGTIATYGFLINYALVTIAAPVYLYKEKELKVKDIAISAITFIILLIPIVGSIYPLPAYPYNILPFIFLAWLVVGSIWFVIQKVKNPSLVSNIKIDVQRINEQFKSDKKNNYLRS